MFAESFRGLERAAAMKLGWRPAVENIGAPFSLETKRFYIPARLWVDCPDCGTTCVKDFNNEYMSYPEANSLRFEQVVCPKDNEFVVPLRVKVTIELA